MNTWVLDKARPLGQILQEQGALPADAHALLEALVAKHLQLHGDADKSLAALRSAGPVAQELQQIADAELHASLAHVSPTKGTHPNSHKGCSLCEFRCVPFIARQWARTTTSTCSRNCSPSSKGTSALARGRPAPA
jgi:hypothetical protein